MTRVAMLAHVKESTIVETTLPPQSRVRIPWTGGKIVSNKDEALRKFYERKLRTGAATLSVEQRRALEASIAALGNQEAAAQANHGRHHKSKHDVVHKINPTTKRMAHRAKVKATSHSHQQTTIVVVNGRVVGPRVHKQPKASAPRGAKPATKSHSQQPHSAAARTNNTSDAAGLALHDKLDMSLDALLKRSK